MHLSDSVQTVKGVGEQTLKKLNKLNIYTVEELLYHFPREHEDRTQIKKIRDIAYNESNTILAKICTMPQNMKIGKQILTKVGLRDETGSIFGIWYGQPYLKKQFKLNDAYIFTGKIVYKYGQIQMESPEYEKFSNHTISTGRIVPIYPTTYKLSQKVIRQIILNAIKETQNQLVEFLPKWIRKQYKLADHNYAIYNIHFPESNEGFFIARNRLVFGELFLLQTALMKIKSQIGQNKKGIIFKLPTEINSFVDKLPFKLTNAQQRVFGEIKEDMKNDKIMNRLVQGDVGSGKTIIAALALFVAVRNGYQGVMMAPTEVLTTQHYNGLLSLLEKHNIKTGLLTGSLSKKKKEALLGELERGEVDIVFGTHALIEGNVQFKNLGLVITDEQHRFGVRQRAILSEKGNNPDVIIMTATPIPRTLALILYGDLDISIIDELPPGRQNIDTYSVDTSYRHRIYKFIEKEIISGRQAYIICPMVEESENDELQSVVSYTEKVRKELTGITIDYLHGKMRPKEKQKIMDAFLKGEIQVLVSTTVVEVGVNIPNATIMLIENAERFGLAQLHQLRGRVGRSSYKSYCILITDSKSKLTAQRMKVMRQTNSGFEISETDLKLRGPGEFFGTRQHGLPEFKIANLYKDIPILKNAQEAAAKLLLMDPNLEMKEHKQLKQKIDLLFNEESIKISL
ncbi:MAG: ATP-dependent DNA helicase RecG [Epulopiscium sp.]|nr:ATP-dependent DNA helicase RecG [Candidatus Epulonipiscium sp.]